MAPLIVKHFMENDPSNGRAPFDPDFDAYFAMERDGKLGVLTARNPEIIGINCFIITPGLFQKSTLVATHHLLLVDPKARGGSVAYKLIKKAEPDLRAYGVKMVYYNPASMTSIDPLLLRAKYAKIGGLFTKYIGD